MPLSMDITLWSGQDSNPGPPDALTTRQTTAPIYIVYCIVKQAFQGHISLFLIIFKF